MANIMLIVIITIWLAFNALVSKVLPVKEMKKNFVRGCLISKILTNAFFLPAWILKGVRMIVIVIIS